MVAELSSEGGEIGSPAPRLQRACAGPRRRSIRQASMHHALEVGSAAGVDDLSGRPDCVPAGADGMTTYTVTVVLAWGR